jgi:hypothetical protein
MNDVSDDETVNHSGQPDHESDAVRVQICGYQAVETK